MPQVSAMSLAYCLKLIDDLEAKNSNLSSLVQLFQNNGLPKLVGILSVVARQKKLRQIKMIANLIMATDRFLRRAQEFCLVIKKQRWMVREIWVKLNKKLTGAD